MEVLHCVKRESRTEQRETELETEITRQPAGELSQGGAP
jgi:hypothetical protein